jgi:hypothetical protein
LTSECDFYWTRGEFEERDWLWAHGGDGGAAEGEEGEMVRGDIWIGGIGAVNGTTGVIRGLGSSQLSWS